MEQVTGKAVDVEGGMLLSEWFQDFSKYDVWRDIKRISQGLNRPVVEDMDDDDGEIVQPIEVFPEGFCYLSVVKSEFRGDVRTALGSCPQLIDLLRVCGDLFDDNLLDAVRVSGGGDVWHFSAAGSVSARSFLFINSYLRFGNLPRGSLGRMVVDADGRGGPPCKWEIECVVSARARVGVDTGIGDVNSGCGKDDVAWVGPPVVGPGENDKFIDTSFIGSVKSICVGVHKFFSPPLPIDRREGFVYKADAFQHVLVRGAYPTSDEEMVDIGQLPGECDAWYLTNCVMEGNLKVNIVPRGRTFRCWYLGPAYKDEVLSIRLTGGESIKFPEYGGLCFWTDHGCSAEIETRDSASMTCLVKDMTHDAYLGILETFAGGDVLGVASEN